MGLVLLGTVVAQETTETPSGKTKEAVQKFIQMPETISRSLEALTDAAKKKL